MRSVERGSSGGGINGTCSERSSLLSSQFCCYLPFSGYEQTKLQVSLAPSRPVPRRVDRTRASIFQAAPFVARTAPSGCSESSENPRLSRFNKARSDGVAPSMRRNVRVR